MNANRLMFKVLVLSSSAIFQLAAQQTEDDQKPIQEITAKSEAGDADSEFQLGLRYERGAGVPRDSVRAVEWYRRAAEQNHVRAQYYLGRCYYDGVGVAKDRGEALKWFRKSAEQNYSKAQHSVGVCYYDGQGVTKNYVEAVNWFRKAAAQNHAEAQFNLGICYEKGEGVSKNEIEAVNWYRRAAEQNLAEAQFNLGICYDNGRGVAKNYPEAVKWYRKAAEQNLALAQYNLSCCYRTGDGTAKNYVEAYKWRLLAAGQGVEIAKKSIDMLENQMTPEQIADGQNLAQKFKPRRMPSTGSNSSSTSILQSRPEAFGSGFFITNDGYLITNQHVAGGGAQIRVLTVAGIISARVVKVDVANDLTLLKADGKFAAVPVTTSRPVKLGDTVATVGFPNVGLQGFAPKLARGEIGSLSGPRDDARYFQISVPVQPGNSGGALVDDRGNVVGVVSAKLSAKAALATSGALPENVNYAVKSSFLLGFLESLPEVAAKLKKPNEKDVKFADVVEQAKEAAVLVLVY